GAEGRAADGHLTDVGAAGGGDVVAGAEEAVGPAQQPRDHIRLGEAAADVHRPHAARGDDVAVLAAATEAGVAPEVSTGDDRSVGRIAGDIHQPDVVAGADERLAHRGRLEPPDRAARADEATEHV